MALAFTLPWSFSTLDMYDTCPKKLYHIKVAKDAKDEDSEFSADGKIAHDALYKRVVKGEALPLPLRHYEDIAAKYANLPGEKHGELKLALNKDLKPVAFFDRSAWVRAIIDLNILLTPTQALVVDWKTGKPKDGFDQLKLSAAVLSRYMPEIEKFTLAYVWINHRDVPPSVVKMEKPHMRAVWADNFEKVIEIEEALKTTTFPARENPLCKWCPVRQCPHNKKGK